MDIAPAHQADALWPALTDAAAFRAYFEREGYIVVRNALPPALCAEAVDAFLTEVHLEHRALFLRQAPARYAAHTYTAAGHMQHPIVNLQDLCPRRYPQFRAAALALLTDGVLRRAVETVLGAPACLLDSMYFDANQIPWAQRDGRAIDAVGPSAMVGAWIAAEDAQAGAGRCYVLPRSHLRPASGWRGEQPLRARAPMADFAAQGPLRQAAPLLQQGDLLLWSAMTVHGSLPTTRAASSRRALCGHYGVSAAAPGAATTRLGGIDVVHQRDPRSPAGRAANLLRAQYPGAYLLWRRLALLAPWTRPGQ